MFGVFSTALYVLLVKELVYIPTLFLLTFNTANVIMIIQSFKFLFLIKVKSRLQNLSFLYIIQVRHLNDFPSLEFSINFHLLKIPIFVFRSFGKD